jgi:hypothetical protein
VGQVAEPSDELEVLVHDFAEIRSGVCVEDALAVAA